MECGAEKAAAYLDLLADPGRLYRQAADSVRRDLLRAFFIRMVVEVEDDRSLNPSGERNEANTLVHELAAQLVREAGESGEREASEQHRSPSVPARASKKYKLWSTRSVGSSKTHLAVLLEIYSNYSVLPFEPSALRAFRAPGDERSLRPAVGSSHVHALPARLGEDRCAELTSRYQNGESANSLAKECGVAPSALLNLLRTRGVVVRSRVRNVEQADQLKREYEAGATVAQLKQQHSLSHTVVLRSLHAIGTKMRATGRPHR